MSDSIYTYFIGTAGSGKTTMVAGMKEWCSVHGFNCMTVNLDPGVEKLPYTPDVDIREWVSIKEIMEENDLGPNGAQVVCADMAAIHFKDVKKAIDENSADIVLIDTPGQVELFAFRESSRVFVNSNEERSIMFYLFDPMLCKKPADFIASQMLASTVQFRFKAPMEKVISKSDLLSDEEIEAVGRWTSDQYALENELDEDSDKLRMPLSNALIRALMDIDTMGSVIPVSSTDMFGFEDIYNSLSTMFAGGDDVSGEGKQ